MRVCPFDGEATPVPARQDFLQFFRPAMPAPFARMLPSEIFELQNVSTSFSCWSTWLFSAAKSFLQASPTAFVRPSVGGNVGWPSTARMRSSAPRTLDCQFVLQSAIHFVIPSAKPFTWPHLSRHHTW